MTRDDIIHMPRAVVEQLLEALEYHVEQTRPIHRTSEAITALRAALAQPIDIEAEADRRGRVLAAEMRAALAQPALRPEPERVAVQEQDIEDAIEAAYWHFDARKKGLNEWASAPQSERDAFKAETRKLVKGYFPTRQAQDTKREMLAVANAFIRGKRAALAQPAPEPVGWLHKWAYQDDGLADTDWAEGYEAARRVVRIHLEAPQPEPEPVAWLVMDESGYVQHAASWRDAAHEHINDAINEHDLVCARTWRVVPVYTAPPKRKPLTDEEIDVIWKNHVLPGFGERQKFYSPIVYARAIEAAHNIKE